MDPKPRPNHERYLAILRSMTPAERLAKTFELSEFGKQLFKAGLRRRHPSLDDDEFHQVFLREWAKCHNRNY